MKHSQKGFTVQLLIIFIVLVLGGGSYIYIKNIESSKIASSSVETQVKNLGRPSGLIFPEDNPTPIIDEKAPSKDGDIYNLFLKNFAMGHIPNVSCSTNDIESVLYHDYGIYSSGPYAGYHIIAAALKNGSPESSSCPMTLIFVTKDYKSFLVEISKGNGIIENPDYLLYKEKVSVTTDKLLDYPQQTINLNSFTFVEYGIIPGASLGTPLKTPWQNFNVYNSETSSGTSTSYKEISFAGSSDVYIQNAQGVIFKYALWSNENRTRQPNNIWDGFVFYTKNEISTSTNLYENYGALYPGCGNRTPVELQHVSPNDLSRIATTPHGVDIYTFKNQSHPFNTEVYTQRSTSFDGLKYNWATRSNDKVSFPSYQDYVAKNPILIFQDYFGRWIILGEWDNYTAPGC